ncbi:hypothetical protein ACXYMO_04760 [Arenibacterium sp. CAU 1754]
MSEKLESLIENLSTKEAARLMTVANEISAAARAEFGMDVPLDDIAALVQVRDAVFHGGLDDMDVSNALYNLKANSEAVRAHLANSEGLAAAKMGGADPEATELTAETLAGVRNLHLRMKLARQHGIGLPAEADRGQRRPDAARKDVGYESVAQTIEDAIARMNRARGIT